MRGLNWLGRLVLVVTAVSAQPLFLNAETGTWSQFRGPNGSGTPVVEKALPAEIGPETNVIWKTELPPGHSSPAISGNRIFLTTAADGKLFTIGLDRETGKVLWRQEAPATEPEEIHRIGSHAQPSPCTDGSRVVSFFGSSGLYCYDTEGKLLWKKPFGPFKNNFGAGSSPLIVEDRVILCQDHDTDSFLTALNKETGEVIWTTDRSEFPRNYATPVIWEVEGRKQIVVAATLRVVGYDFETGKEIWTVRGISRIVNMTPVIGPDGTLFAACWAPGGDENDRIQAPTFAEMIKNDKNDNLTLELDEVLDDAIKRRYTQIDRDKSGSITEAEYESMRRVFETARNVVIAIRPGGTGDITETHVIWQYNKLIPYCPSPVFAGDHVFMVKDGGIVSCLDAKTGKPGRQGRVSANGSYYSSPVTGDGKVYLLDQRGELTVISASPDWEEISKAEFGEEAYATPAIVDGKIYLRTVGHLYCFGLPESKSK